MKILKFIGHPVILIIIYLLLVIEGDEFGGFFMMYLMLALPHLVPYSVVAGVGLLLVIVAFNMSAKYWRVLPILYLLGYILMIVSLVMFFEKGNKWQTFELTVPRFTFIVFGFISICFLVNLVSSFVSTHVKRL